MNLDSTGRERLRKRARVACSWCHDRKVRCDVSVQGPPCTNCKFDCHQCSLPTSKSSNQIRHSRKTQSQLPPRRTASQTSKIGQGQVSRRTPGLPQLEPNDLLSTTSTFPLQSSSYDFPCEMSQFTEPPVVGRQSFGLEMPTAITDYMLQLGVAPAISEHPVPSANIPFASYSFIAFPRLDQMPFEDVSFLELKGCFRLPERPYLDVFITKYFLFVHPCLPVLDEAEFWRIYNLKNHQNEFSKKISMFVLQAMLFASCVFVPVQTLNAVGLKDTRVARTTLYQRAKLLFEFDTEIDVLSKAQGALLLSLQTTVLDFFSGTHWLSVATQLAKSTDASTLNDDVGCESDAIAKKRLWWCIIVRDRIHSLALRRPTQLGPEQGRIPLDYLNEVDLEQEIESSSVYAPQEKRRLLMIFRLQCHLAVIITEIVDIAYAPLWGTLPKSGSPEDISRIQNEIDHMQSGLQRWRDTAEKLLENRFNSVGVLAFTKLTYIYYDSARLAVNHYEGLIWDMQNVHMFPSRMQFIKGNIEEAIKSMTEIVKELITQGLACLLPISVVAHVALPLLLSTVDSWFSSTRLQRNARRRHLHFYKEAMRVLGSQYEAADKVCTFIDSALSSSGVAFSSELAHIGSELDHSDGASTSLGSADEQISPIQPKPVSGFRFKSISEYFGRQTRSYLRLSLALDYALCRGQFPRKSDFEKLCQKLQLVDSQQLCSPVTEQSPSASLSIQLRQPSIPCDLSDPHALHTRRPHDFDHIEHSLGSSNDEWIVNGFITPSDVMMHAPLQS